MSDESLEETSRRYEEIEEKIKRLKPRWIHYK